MRFYLTNGVAPRAAVLLRERGFDAVHVSEIAMQQATDVEILARARAEERVCVTFDHDFHAHLAIAGEGRPSVILLRVERLDSDKQAELVTAICGACEAALRDGAAVSADGECVRIRRLPLR